MPAGRSRVLKLFSLKCSRATSSVKTGLETATFALCLGGSIDLMSFGDSELSNWLASNYFSSDLLDPDKRRLERHQRLTGGL